MRTARIYFVLIISGCFLVSCGSLEKPVPPFGTANELVVITVKYSENFYQKADGSYSGLAHDLVNEFARELGLKLRFIIKQRPEDALYAIQTQQGHFAIGLNVPAQQRARVRLGPIYQHKQYQVAYNTNNLKPKNFQDLVKKNIEVSAGSIYETKLNKIKREIPDLEWSAVDISSANLLYKLAGGEINYTVSETFQIKQAKHFYPNLGIAFNIGETLNSRWVFPQFVEQSLINQAKRFFARIKQDGTLNQLLDRYNGHLQRLQEGDIYYFLKKMRVELTSLRDYFDQAEVSTGIDWRLIAALAYQESHWNPLAKSHTGVRGIMMLTRDTAKRMKVTNRLDAQQSILAGARYLQLLKNKLPEQVAEPDRTWIALAAYNQGYGHILDARMLARRFKLNPNLWVDLKKTLPLLSKREFFDSLKFGRTRGGEAVILTESVRAYYDIIKKYHPTDSDDSVYTASLP